MHYSLMGKMRLPFIDSDLLFRGALEGRFDCLFIDLITGSKIRHTKKKYKSLPHLQIQ
jgi:hypothetical protein